MKGIQVESLEVDRTDDEAVVNLTVLNELGESNMRFKGSLSCYLIADSTGRMNLTINISPPVVPSSDSLQLAEVMPLT